MLPDYAQLDKDTMTKQNPNSTFQQALRLQRLTRQFQKLNNYVSKDSTLGVSLSELMVMLEFDPGIVRTVNEITERTHFDQSTVSRIVTSLKNQSLLKSAPSQDARSRPVMLTSIGQNRLISNDKEINQSIITRLKILPSNQTEAIIKNFSNFSTALNAPATLKRRTDHPLRYEVRRMTKALGILEKKIVGKSLNTTEWNILSEIKETPSLISATELSHALFMIPKVMASAVARLVKRGFVKRVVSKRDKRESFLELTHRGENELRSINEEAANLICDVIKKGSISNPNAVCAAFELYVYWREKSSSTSKWSEAKSESQRSLARGFIVREALKYGIEEELPESICTKRNKVYVCTATDGTMQGVLDISQTGKSFAINYSAIKNCSKASIIELGQIIKPFSLSITF